MYAVIEVKGKQFKVQKGDRFAAEGFGKAKDGDSIDIKKVLLAKEGNTVQVGNPYLKGASATCTVVRHFRGEKTIAFKFRRRKASKKMVGGRQYLAELKVETIQVEGKE